MINAHLSFFDSTTWTVLIVSVLGIVFALTPFGKIKGTEEISNVMLYIVIALIASRADLGAVGNAPIWLLAGFVILLIHVAIMIALAKILKLDIFTCSRNKGLMRASPLVFFFLPIKPHAPTDRVQAFQPHRTKRALRDQGF